MGTVREDFEKLLGKLAQERDELRLKIHLGKAEARDEWEKIEKRWQHLRGKSELVKDVVDDTAREIGDAAVQAAREIQRGYERLRKLM